MRTRNGKIARLPRHVREQINERLECCQGSPEILQWLNALPEVQEMVKSQFGGAPISRQNLSQWHLGGFQEALVRRDLALDVRDMSDLVADMEEEQSETQIVDDAATVLAAKLGVLAVNWDGEADERFEARIKILNSIARTLAQMQRQSHSAQNDIEHRRAAQEEREKAEIKETKNKLTGRWFDAVESKVLAPTFGGGTIGRKIASYVLAVRRGDLDATIDFAPDDTFGDGTLWGEKPVPSQPVKPCQSDSGVAQVSKPAVSPTSESAPGMEKAV